MNYEIQKRKYSLTKSDIFSNKWDGALSWTSDNGDHTKYTNAAPGEKSYTVFFVSKVAFFLFCF